jgi:hypothetical protein
MFEHDAGPTLGGLEEHLDLGELRTTSLSRSPLEDEPRAALPHQDSSDLERRSIGIHFHQASIRRALEADDAVRSAASISLPVPPPEIGLLGEGVERILYIDGDERRDARAISGAHDGFRLRVRSACALNESS